MNVDSCCTDEGLGRDEETTDREMYAFLNRVKSLYNIDGYLLPELDAKRDWPKFRDDPPRYFITDADLTQLRAIWREVEKRQR